jgi:putative DNA primase/helicase
MDYLDILDNHLISKDNILDVDFSISQLREYFDSDIQTYKNKLINNFHHTTAFKYFNNYHAYFYLVDGVYKIFNSEIIPYKKFNNTFKEIIYKDEIENGKIKEYKFTDLFDKCIYKRQYSTFDFEPNKKICDDKFNLFLGFKYDDNKIKFDINKINHFLNHIKFICSNNDEVYKYFISWMAHIIQKPEIKTKVALVLYSIIEGVGKNIIFDIFGELLNGYNAKFTNTEAIGEKFNSDLMGKLFVIGDEVKGRKTDIMNELKDIITRLEENIELKGKDKFKIHDYKNYAFTTNNENIFKISSSDRRFMLIECPEVKKDNEYYKLLFDMILEKETLKHLHFYLKNYDLTNFNPMNIITTDYKKNIILCNIPPYIKFLKDNFASYENDQFTALDLYNKSLEYARVNKMNSTYSEQLFYKQFKKVFGKYYYSGRSVYYNFICNIDDINKCIEDNLI